MDTIFMPENDALNSRGELLAQTRPPVIDITQLQPVSDFGFVGGRDSLRTFCRRAFAPGAPRFLRNANNDLVVFRHVDLRAMGSLAPIANVPPGIMYPGLTLEEASSDLPPEGQRPPRMAVASILSNQFFTMNPPIHGPVRKLLVNQLGPRQVSQLEGLARETIRTLLEDLPRDQDVDFVAEFCEKLTARFFGTLIGMTDDEKIAIVESVREMTPLFFLDPNADDLDLLDVGAGHWRDLIETATLRMLHSGKSPMLTAMAENLAKIDHEEDVNTVGMVPRNIGAFMAGNLIDGFHTIALGACNTVYALLQQPGALAQLHESPENVPRAVFEALRLESPAIFFRRYVIEDVEYAGCIIPKGTFVAMFWSAGNHDPMVFPEPEQFDLTRSHGGVTTFGGGFHICPGRYVTTMLIRLMLEALVEQKIQLERVDGPSQWHEGHFMSQLKSMPVRVHHASASCQ